MDRMALSLGDDERAFVFRYVADEGAVGVFVPMTSAPAVGTSVTLSVAELVLDGVVGWRNDDASDTPGAGVVLEDSDNETVDALLAEIRVIAYLPREEGS
jgi:mRNA-degrading endonuclease toxin of MazEF toxin-antitoxin module